MIIIMIVVIICANVLLIWMYVSQKLRSVYDNAV